MKLHVLILCITSAISATEFLSKKEASTLVRSNRAAQGLWKKDPAKLKKKWNNYCKFNSPEKWTEFKDDLEETDLPEKQVDQLERCVFKCNRFDEAQDFIGKAYEENREKQEEKGTQFMMACPKCEKMAKKMLVSYGYDFPRKLRNGKECKNSKAGFGYGIGK